MREVLNDADKEDNQDIVTNQSKSLINSGFSPLKHFQLTVSCSFDTPRWNEMVMYNKYTTTLREIDIHNK